MAEGCAAFHSFGHIVERESCFGTTDYLAADSYVDIADRGRYGELVGHIAFLVGGYVHHYVERRTRFYNCRKGVGCSHHSLFECRIINGQGVTAAVFHSYRHGER